MEAQSALLGRKARCRSDVGPPWFELGRPQNPDLDPARCLTDANNHVCMERHTPDSPTRS